jgi:hypothetical protein
MAFHPHYTPFEREKRRAFKEKPVAWAGSLHRTATTAQVPWSPGLRE